LLKIKLKNKENKQILLISNEDCLTVKKNQFPNKKLNDFIVNSKNVNEIGKVLIENNEYLTITKRKTLFFPKL
jgi:sporulation protein YlmC with PRC-barrel domain